MTFLKARGEHYYKYRFAITCPSIGTCCLFSVNEEIYQAVEEERRRRLCLASEDPQSSGNTKIVVNDSETHKPTKESVKRKFEDDFDDVFSFSAQENKTVKLGVDRHSGSTSSSSLGKWTPRSSIESTDKIKFEPSAIRSQRPNTLSKNFAHKFHESVLQSTLRVTGKCC